MSFSENRLLVERYIGLCVKKILIQVFALRAVKFVDTKDRPIALQDIQ